MMYIFSRRNVYVNIIEATSKALGKYDHVLCSNCVAVTSSVARKLVCNLCSTIPAATPTLRESNPGGRCRTGGMVTRTVQARLNSLRTPYPSFPITNSYTCFKVNSCSGVLLLVTTEHLN